MKKKLVSFFMILQIVTAVALCGCTGDTTGGDPEQKSSDSSVKYGGKITVGITQDLDSLDPHKAVAAGTEEVLINIFDGLIKVASNGDFVPAVASSYEISEDGLKYAFTLRKGVKFHNGKEVTADDVIYSLKRVAGLDGTPDPEVLVKSAFSVIKEINKTEDGVEVILSEPATELIGFFTCSIIPCDYDAQATAPIGCGPFKFVSYEPMRSIVLEKNEDYYVEGVPYLDGVTFKISADTDAAFLELMAGGIDIFPYLTADQANQLKGNYNIEDGTMNLVQALFLNNAREPFTDVRVRQAICYALDRQGIINVVAEGKGEVIGTNMFPTFGRYYDASLVNKYPTNIEKAKELLKEAGYEGGISFTITIPSNYDFHVKTGEVITQQLKAAGIDAKIKLIEWSSWLSDVYAGRDFESTIIGLDSELAPSDILRFYPSDSSKNFINYSNPEFDRIYTEAKKTSSEDEKEKLYKQLEAILTDDAASAYIQSPAQLVAVNKKLTGYTFYPVYVQDMSTVGFVE